MTRLSTLLASLTADESGQDLVEYALIVALIALASIVMMRNLASTIATTLGALGTRLTGAI
jgi:pilus assembly protein Flp/PilA